MKRVIKFCQLVSKTRMVGYRRKPVGVSQQFVTELTPLTYLIMY